MTMVSQQAREPLNWNNVTVKNVPFITDQLINSANEMISLLKSVRINVQGPGNALSNIALEGRKTAITCMKSGVDLFLGQLSSIEISAVSISLDFMYISILFSSELSVPLSALSVLSFTSVLKKSLVIRRIKSLLIKRMIKGRRSLLIKKKKSLVIKRIESLLIKRMKSLTIKERKSLVIKERKSLVIKRIESLPLFYRQYRL
jgi:hypothetical protein